MCIVFIQPHLNQLIDNMRLPEFAEGIHYSEMRGNDPRSSGVYRFILLQPISINLEQLCLNKKTISFRDKKGKEWACIIGDRLLIHSRYAWNGASPKKWLFGRWIGTPDFEETRLATLIHDVFFQFLRTENFPLSIESCNRIFLDIMKARKFKLANTYFGAVIDFGERFAGKYPPDGEYSIVS